MKVEQPNYLVSYCRRCGRIIARSRLGHSEWWSPRDDKLEIRCSGANGRSYAKYHIPYSTDKEQAIDMAKAELREIFLETS